VQVPDPPKRPLNAYMRFLNEYFNAFNWKEIGLQSRELRRQLTAVWHAFTIEDKKPYQEAFVKDMLVYKSLEGRWWGSLTMEQKQRYFDNLRSRRNLNLFKRLKRKFRLMGKPKRPMLAIYQFLFEQEEEGKNKKGKMESFKSNVQAWKNMPIKEKQPYLDATKIKFQEHEFAYYAWELRMMKQGHGDLIRQYTKLRTELNKEKSKKL